MACMGRMGRNSALPLEKNSANAHGVLFCKTVGNVIRSEWRVPHVLKTITRLFVVFDANHKLM